MSLNQLSSRELESHCLAGLIKHPDILPEIDNFVSDDCFYCGETSEHKIIFSITKKLILDNKKFDNVLIAQKISELNINLGDLSPFDYLEAITQFDINKEACIENFKELAKLKYLRDEYLQAEKVKKSIVSNRSKPVLEIISEIDKLKNEKTAQIFQNKEEFTGLFSDIEDYIEGIADNPPKEDGILYGPFNSINELYGPLHQPGNIVVIAARSGVGKTAFSFFYNTYIAEKYNLPCLHIDFNEMSPTELQMRAICMFTKGKVPLWALMHGKWRQNPDWLKLVREVWPRVKKIKYDYFQCGGLDSKGIISAIRRFSYNKVGRGNPFIVNFDYVKPLKEGDSEYKTMGHFMDDIKRLIQNEINVPFWCSVQTNRAGITNNKKSEDIDDSENVIGMSDRIGYYASFTFLMRKKIMEEVAYENNLFGNLALKNIGKQRQMISKRYFDALNPVEYEKGKYKANYINLNQDSFYFEDRGDLKTMVEALKEKYETQPDNDNGMGLI